MLAKVRTSEPSNGIAPLVSIAPPPSDEKMAPDEGVVCGETPVAVWGKRNTLSS